MYVDFNGGLFYQTDKNLIACRYYCAWQVSRVQVVCAVLKGRECSLKCHVSSDVSDFDWLVDYH